MAKKQSSPPIKKLTKAQETAKRAAAKGNPQEKEACILDGCSNPQYCRGLCNPCYYAAWIARKNGTESEEDLVKRGLLLPSAMGRRSTSTFAQMTRNSRGRTAPKLVKKATKKAKKKGSKKKAKAK